MPPRFSVIMAVYNHQDYVEQAVRSVLAQTYQDFELIAVDDGSTDSSLDILKRLARSSSRLIVVHQPNRGAASARNRAAGQALGDWLAYLDSDDIWFPETLALYDAYLHQHPDAKFIHGYAHRLRGSKITERTGECQSHVTGTRELFQRMYLNPIGVCHRRDLWRLVGGYDEGLRSCEDYDFFLKLSLHSRFEPLAKPTGLHRRHTTNISRRSATTQEREAEVLRRFAEERGGLALVGDRVVARRLARLYLRAAQQHFKSRQYRRAELLVKQALNLQPTLRARVFALASRWLAVWDQAAA